MTFETKPAAFAAVADRLGKLIPRLASDHDGEVTVTVAAIVEFRHLHPRGRARGLGDPAHDG